MKIEIGKRTESVSDVESSIMDVIGYRVYLYTRHWLAPKCFEEFS